MLNIIQLETNEHLQAWQQLLWEYADFLEAVEEEYFHRKVDMHTLMEETIEKWDRFAPPQGRLLLAEYEGNMVGCIALQTIADKIGEIKRFYVRSAYQRRGIGRSLLVSLIAESRQMGYVKLRLDSPKFLDRARSLYSSVGFEPIAPYPETEIPEKYYPDWVFMELTHG